MMKILCVKEKEKNFLVVKNFMVKDLFIHHPDNRPPTLLRTNISPVGKFSPFLKPVRMMNAYTNYLSVMDNIQQIKLVAQAVTMSIARIEASTKHSDVFFIITDKKATSQHKGLGFADQAAGYGNGGSFMVTDAFLNANLVAKTDLPNSKIGRSFVSDCFEDPCNIVFDIEERFAGQTVEINGQAVVYGKNKKGVVDGEVYYEVVNLRFVPSGEFDGLVSDFHREVAIAQSIAGKSTDTRKKRPSRVAYIVASGYKTPEEIERESDGGEPAGDDAQPQTAKQKAAAAAKAAAELNTTLA